MSAAIQAFSFPSSMKPLILKAFDIKTSPTGILIDGRTDQQIFTQDAEEVSIHDFAVVKQGSLVFLKSDLPSLVQLAEDLE